MNNISERETAVSALDSSLSFQVEMFNPGQIIGPELNREVGVGDNICDFAQMKDERLQHESKGLTTVLEETVSGLGWRQGSREETEEELPEG